MFNECIRVLCNVHLHPDNPVFKWNIYVAAPTGDDSVLDRAKWLSNAYPSDVFSYKHPDRDEIFLYRGKAYTTLPLDILASVYKNSDMRYLVASFDTTIYPDPTDQLAPREWSPRLLTSSRAAADMYVKRKSENCGRHSYILFWYDIQDDQSVYYSVDSYGLCVEHSPFKRMKIKRILVTRHEGNKNECREYEVSCIADANKLIREMAVTAPDGNKGYHKISIGVWVEPAINETDLLWSSVIGIDKRHIGYFSLKDVISSVYRRFGGGDFEWIARDIDVMSETDYTPSGVSIHTMLKKLHGAIDYSNDQYWLNSTDPMMKKMLNWDRASELYSDISMILGIMVRSSDHTWTKEDYLQGMEDMLEPVFRKLGIEAYAGLMTKAPIYTEAFAHYMTDGAMPVAHQQRRFVDVAKEVYTSICYRVYRNLIESACF